MLWLHIYRSGIVAFLMAIDEAWRQGSFNQWRNGAEAIKTLSRKSAARVRIMLGNETACYFIMVSIETLGRRLRGRRTVRQRLDGAYW